LLYLNIAHDKEGVDKAGDKIYEPYERTIHEVWHNIDHLAGSMVNSDSNKFFSYNYKELIPNAIKADIIDKINVDINLGVTNMSEEELERLYKFAGEKFVSFSDIIDGITGGRLDLFLKHGAEYWKGSDILSPDALLAKEVFADIAAADMANKEASKLIKINLKKTYNVYLKILNDMPK
jgi:hypothetical protein